MILVHDNNLHEQEVLMRPNDLGSYRKKGYFKIDPRTILVSLDRGDTNVFMPMSEGSQDDKTLTDRTIYWTQKDFLKIARALGQTVWDDPMEWKDWSVAYIYFDANCGDPIGLYSAIIAYFKKADNNYVTRFIEVDPNFGWVKWGDEAYFQYPQPILRKWVGVDLSAAKITADDALRLVNEDIKANFQVADNLCGVMMDSSRFDPKNWQLEIYFGPEYTIFYKVNLYTGAIIRRTK
jgi:hypothetical protein